MTRLVAADLIWFQGALRSGLSLETAGGTVIRVRPLAASETPDLHVRLIGPALTDLQVNGSGGVMFNSEPTERGIAHIVETQRRRGTAWVMPTLITCEGERMRRAADAVIEAWGMAGLFGVHIEGPHIAAARKGTHSAAFVRPIDDVTLDVLERLRRRGVPVMLTLAPEVVPNGVVRRIAELGVVISAGHSAASAEATRAGLDAGIGCFTHLYNAMPPMTSRDPGILGAAINSEAFAGVIVDGHHVAWEMVGLACRARPLPRRMFMVSDAMATIGGPDHFDLYSERIEVRDGALVNAAGSLAGAHIDLVGCLRNAVRYVGLSIEEAYEMAALVPRDAMRVDRPEILAGQPLSEVLTLTSELARMAL